MSCMLMMVIENPIQLTIVSEVPLSSAGAFWATRVENRGESAMTTKLQKNRKVISVGNELLKSNNGESRQHTQESDRAMVAIFFVPKYCESIPLATHANPPKAMIRKDSNGISRS